MHLNVLKGGAAATAHLMVDAPHKDLRRARSAMRSLAPTTTGSATAIALNVSASTPSFHLKELARAGLVSQQRDGRHLIYRPGLAHMNELIAYLVAHCCRDEPCDVAPAARCADC